MLPPLGTPPDIGPHAAYFSAKRTVLLVPSGKVAGITGLYWAVSCPPAAGFVNAGAFMNTKQFSA